MMDWTGIVDYYPWNGILEIAIACCRNRGSEFSALKRKQFPRGLISVINALIWAKHLSSICWSFVGGGLSFSIYFVHTYGNIAARCLFDKHLLIHTWMYGANVCLREAPSKSHKLTQRLMTACILSWYWTNSTGFYNATCSMLWGNIFSWDSDSAKLPSKIYTGNLNDGLFLLQRNKVHAWDMHGSKAVFSTKRELRGLELPKGTVIEVELINELQGEVGCRRMCMYSVI